MQKLKNIEFLRIVGCLAIILLHLFNNNRLHGLFGDIELYDKIFKMTSNGQKAVDLFFMLSGFFFALKLDTTKSLWEFLKNKLIRLYPVLIFISILCYIMSRFGIIKYKLYDNILGLCGIDGTSLVINHGNTGIFWYVSAMLWILIFFYYLLKNYDKKHVNLFISLLVFFCYSFLIHAKGGKINDHTQTFDYIYNVGMMRGFGGIGLGYLIAEWYKNNINTISNLTLSIKSKIAITGLEFICLYFIINNLMLHKLQYKNHMIFIISFIAIIVLFLIKQGFISKLLDNKFGGVLSKYTYSLYMTHIMAFDLFCKYLWKHCPEWVHAHPVQNVIYTLIGVFILGVFTYHFVEKPSTAYLKKKFIK